MRVAGTIFNSVVNGIGIRDVLFVQGCTHYCKGCHNPKTWNTDGGTEIAEKELVKQFLDSPNDITISGGEPLLQLDEVLTFMLYTRLHSNKRFWLYTGYKYEDIPKHWLLALSPYVDVLVDGRYEEDKRDLTLQFRGSSNQRLIDLKKSLLEDKIVEWEEYDEK